MRNTLSTQRHTPLALAFATAIAALMAAVLLGLAGCSNGAASESSSSEGKPRQVVVATGSDYDGICAYNENGELDGYEIAVLKEIDKRLDQYEFTYDVYDFANILLAVDGGKADLGAHQYEWSQEREENYLFSDVGYTTYNNYVAVLEGANDIDFTGATTAEDVLAKLGAANAKTFGSAGGNATAILEQYNAEHPDAQIGIDYVQLTNSEQLIANMANGVWNFVTMTKRDLEGTNAALADYGIKFVIPVDAPLNTTDTYYLYKPGNPDSQQLHDDIDAVLEQLIEDGTLRKLSIQYLGDDYTPQTGKE